MDFTTGIIIAIAIFALIAGVILLFNKGKAKVRISNKLGEFEATNELSAKDYAIKIENAKSREGGIVVDDNTGQGTHLNNINVNNDIRISVSDDSKKKA